MTSQSLKSGWKMVKFGDIAQNVAVRVDPADAKTDVYVGLEHLDPSTIHLRQWGHPSDVTGQKLAFKKGDVIFGRRRAYQRKLAIAEFDGICSAHAMVVRAKPKMILPEFLPFFLQSDMFMEQPSKYRWAHFRRRSTGKRCESKCSRCRPLMNRSALPRSCGQRMK